MVVERGTVDGGPAVLVVEDVVGVVGQETGHGGQGPIAGRQVQGGGAWQTDIVMLRGYMKCKGKGKASSYIAQYPVLRTVQSALHLATLTDLFNQTQSRLLWGASSHMLQLLLVMGDGYLYTYSPLSIARYSFIQLSALEQCRVKKLAQGFNTAAQDLNPGSLSRESGALPLSHCVLHIFAKMIIKLAVYYSKKNS